MGLLDDPDLSANLGIGLLQAGQRNLAGQGGIGTALASGLQNYYGQKQAKQSLAIGDLDLKSKQLQNQKTMQLLDMVGGLMGAPAPGGPPQSGLMSAAPGASPAPAPSQGPPGGSPVGQMPPQGAPPATAGPRAPMPTQAPSWLAPPSQASISQSPIGGMNPRQLQGYNLLSGKDPLQSAKELEQAQREQAQQQYAPALAKLSTVIKSDSPTREVAADPELSDAWRTLAKAHGFDPKADLNDDNLRTAFTFAHNGLASSIGAPTLTPTVKEKTTQGALGSIYQTDPITGKITQVKGEEALKDVIGPDGKPTNMRASAAEGRQPFNQSVFGAASMSDPAMEMAYQQFKATGQMPTGFAKNPAMNAKLMDYFAQRSGQEGDTTTQRLARGQQVKATQGVLNDFEKGKSAQALNGINTAVAHMDALDPLIDGLKNGNLTILNRAQNIFKQATGNPAPTNYAAIKEFVGGEVAKAVLPGGGGEAERKALTDPLNAANSPEALRSAVKQIKTALAGKTEALRNQWDIGTQGNQGEFDRFLLPATKKALGLPDTPAAQPQRPGQGASHPDDIQDLMKKYGN